MSIPISQIKHNTVSTGKAKAFVVIEDHTEPCSNYVLKPMPYKN